MFPTATTRAGSSDTCAHMSVTSVRACVHYVRACACPLRLSTRPYMRVSGHPAGFLSNYTKKIMLVPRFEPRSFRTPCFGDFSHFLTKSRPQKVKKATVTSDWLAGALACVLLETCFSIFFVSWAPPHPSDTFGSFTVSKIRRERSW